MKLGTKKKVDNFSDLFKFLKKEEAKNLKKNSEILIEVSNSA